MSQGSRAAVRFVAGSKNSTLGSLHLRCHVRPGAAKSRQGVLAVTDEAVELCVAAQARDGEANRAVLKLLSEVLQVPKSDLQITQGLKARDKTVALGGVGIGDNDGDGAVAKITEMLKEAVD